MTENGFELVRSDGVNPQTFAHAAFRSQLGQVAFQWPVLVYLIRFKGLTAVPPTRFSTRDLPTPRGGNSGFLALDVRKNGLGRQGGKFRGKNL